MAKTNGRDDGAPIVDMVLGQGVNRPGFRGAFEEIGTLGIEAYAGLIQMAYHTDLEWPDVFDLYNRIRRSDPEVTIVRQVFTSLTREIELDWQLPDNPSDDDRAAQEYGRQVLADIDGGPNKWLEEIVSYVPFMGWGWWEVLWGIRDPSWRPPGGDPWRSEYSDGLLAARRFAFRDHSTFQQWDLDERTGRLRGMVQNDPPNPPIFIPLDRSVHLTFGDRSNPEGLSPLEAIWRLERIKYGLEIIQGIGFEHAAGHLNVVSEKETLSGDDLAHIRNVARALLTAQEANYAAWPKGFQGEIKDINFAAAGSLLEAIRYYGILKLQVFGAQWVAIASTAGTGAYSAVQDASGMFLGLYNAMIEGFVKQIDDQFGRRLWGHQVIRDRFPGMTARPRLTASSVDKLPSLDKLAAFLQAFATISDLGDDDLIAIRRASKIMPDSLPEQPGATQTEEQQQGGGFGASPEEQEGTAAKEEQISAGIEGEAAPSEVSSSAAETAEASFARRPLAVGPGEEPDDVLGEAEITPGDIEAAIRAFNRWAAEHDPALHGLLNAKVEEGEHEQAEAE